MLDMTYEDIGPAPGVDIAPDAGPPAGFDPGFVRRLANAKMPFGKYAGMLLIDLPEAYVVWWQAKGYPSGELGLQLASLYEIKANGLEPLLRPFVGRV